MTTTYQDLEDRIVTRMQDSFDSGVECLAATATHRVLHDEVTQVLDRHDPIDLLMSMGPEQRHAFRQFRPFADLYLGDDWSAGDQLELWVKSFLYSRVEGRLGLGDG